MPAGRVSGFLPSLHGFAFPNCWPSQPLFSVGYRNFLRLNIGDACNGLCGGMIFAVCDFFQAGRRPPELSEPPTYGTPLFAYLRGRLFDSFQLPVGVLRYYRWMTRSGRGKSLARRTVEYVWPRVRQEIDAGRLAPLGLIRVHSWNPSNLGQNHQVLAYAYELDESVGMLRIWLYDPNHPSCDDVTLTIDLRRLDDTDAITASTGEPVRGFLWTRCRTRTPQADVFA